MAHTLHGVPGTRRQPQPNSWLHPWRPVWQRACADLARAPARDASPIAPSPRMLAGAPHGALDGTERRRQRPQDAALHKAHASGKKQAPTEKHLLLGHDHPGQGVSLGPTSAGTMPDKKAADEAHRASPTHATLDKDTGLQGDAPEGVRTAQPKKSPQARQCVGGLSASLPASPVRAASVENVLAGVKRGRMVKEVVRLTKAGLADLVLEMACGWHNLRVRCRHPLPTCDVLSLLNSG